MADLRKAEKLASAKKRLKQFQQRNRDSQSESGRSTPSQKKVDDEFYGVDKFLQSENGGSTYSLSQSENMSSNISRTESPVLASNTSIDNLCQIFNGSSQPDILNGNTLNTLPKVSESFFQNPSPSSFFAKTPSPTNQSGLDFFNNISSGNDLPNGISNVSQTLDLGPEPGPIPNSSLIAVARQQHHGNNATHSTPEGPLFQDTPDYSLPDISFSPINAAKINTSPGVVNNNTLEHQLKKTTTMNDELEQQVIELKNQIVQLQSHLEDSKKKADEGTSTLKHHVQAIEILVSEKTELQNIVDRRHEELLSKNGEVEELQGRLRASRHRVSELERDLSVGKENIRTLESSVREESTHQVNLRQLNEDLGKRVGDLELEICDLQRKLEDQNQTLLSLQVELQDKSSQLSVAQVRIQQLSGGPDSDDRAVDELRQKNEELLRAVSSLGSQLSAETAAKEESMKEYQHYVNRLQLELVDSRSKLEEATQTNNMLVVRESDLVQQVSSLERQLNRAPQTEEDPALQTLRDQLQLAAEHSHAFQSQLEQKGSEVEVLRDGLHERALRIQELEVTVERLEAERPDSVNLQAAIESDKVAAARAMAQNNELKKQLEELQAALVKLSNNKVELTQQLQHEQHLSRDLTEKMEKLQVSKCVEIENEQQTESPLLQEAESQTTHDQPIVSPEVMVKLEGKFRKTMSELADLSEEKQRLEHLVLQLQSETETIGEYITLYQLQRGMLRQRAQEKDEQVARLAQDKEALRSQLTRLNCLVQQLVGGARPLNTTTNLELDVSAVHKGPSETEEAPTSHVRNTNIETAHQIQSLLTEIGSNNLVTSAGEGETTNINFHPCPWCSGRLITV